MPFHQGHHVRVRGQVQGVGFRPFVYRLANELALQGWVRNDAEGVEIMIRGEMGAVSTFLARLEREQPALSRVESVEYEDSAFDDSMSGFSVKESHGGKIQTGITPDAAICTACLAELFNPANRRYRHPLINCTHCGPRYTLLAKLPYDRKNTSMAKFALCQKCDAEYSDSSNRRFHAQPNACHACGPRLFLLDAQGEKVCAGDVIETAVQAIARGKILAIKGIGGFHLVCDAKNEAAVSRLRLSKSRIDRPFAVMVANSASLAPFATVSNEEIDLLESVERPVVLLQKTQNCDSDLPRVATTAPTLGAMLPYAPLHYLLFHEAAGRPDGLSWLDEAQDLVLVATSANPKGETLVIDNGDALDRLSGIADLFLMHDRDILVPCDDSVMRWNGRAPQFFRRARGFTPRALKLPLSGPSVLACGGAYKNTVCVSREDEAFLSQHIGDLDNASSCEALESIVAHLLDVLEIEPEVVVHDLHPDFFSSRFANEFAAKLGIPVLAVQHHHAHVAAVMAEHGVDGSVLGLALDGVGLGADGGIWGGELLLADAEGRFSRRGHLGELALPGGDSAAREPWRMAASTLHALGRTDEIIRRFGQFKGETMLRMFEANLNTPRTSSAGRLFDAAAGLLGVIDKTSFEGQAAMLLEKLASRCGPVLPLDSGFVLEEDGTLNFLPLLEVLADMKDAGWGAALFHSTLAEGLAKWTLEHVGKTGIRSVVFSGGCFLNAMLSRELKLKLGAAGLQILQAERIPPNDGGISLGQAYIALQQKVTVCV